MHALYLVEGGLEIQLLTYDRVLLNDGERLEVLNAINDFRSKVIPTAADMLAVVRKVFLFSQLDVSDVKRGKELQWEMEERGQNGALCMPPVIGLTPETPRSLFSGNPLKFLYFFRLC